MGVFAVFVINFEKVCADTFKQKEEIITTVKNPLKKKCLSLWILVLISQI
jgi:hypothetical protein